METSTEKNIDFQQLDNLFEAIGWHSRGKEKWENALEKSTFVFSVWNEALLIGFGRILEDGIMCMFYDIGVHPDYQGKGVGNQVMEALIDHVKDKEYASIGLFAWKENPSNFPFYEKHGFERMTSGMELVKHMKRE